MDTIRFQIPNTDANYDASAGVWRIRLQTGLPWLTQGGTVIDGYSQAIWYGTDTNPVGPEIVLDGRTAGASGKRGLAIQSSRNTIRGLVIQHFANNGVYIEGDENTISGNFIGTDVSGASALGNGASGIAVFSQPVNTIIGGATHTAMNVVSGNKQNGIVLWGNLTTSIGNKIGTDVTGTFSIGNDWNGIWVPGGLKNVIGGTNPGEGNIISGNKWRGIYVQADSNQVMGNFIGTDSSGTVALGNKSHGIWLAYGAQDNVVGPGNVISNNNPAGVAIGMDSTIHNTITKNSITANQGVGILLYDGGNQELSPPTISNTATSGVTGTAPPNSTVEFFSGPADEGKLYEGTTTADADGNFQWEGTPAGPNITATATDSAGNTSSFSLPISITGVALNPVTDKPVRFELDQNYPNPFNSTTTIKFAVKGRSHVLLQVYDIRGREIITLVDAEYPPGQYRKALDAHTLASGVYFYRIRMGNFEDVKKMLLLR